MTEKVETIAALRARVAAWRKAEQSVGLVPTMGALHRGHMSLLATARAKTKRTVVSVFVNPTQFGPGEDYEKYARQIEKDQALLEENGADILFAPSVGEMYPEGFAVSIDPGPMAKILEGAFRPTHFAGVALVVTKLFQAVLPDAAFFGEKDYQQLLIIQRLVRDLNMPLEIVPVPIVREEDGLALSSRNAYLSAQERKTAPLLSATLVALAKSLREGRDPATALAEAKQQLEAAGFLPDYLEWRDAQTLYPARDFSHPTRLLVAAKLGTTRLIDNWGV